MKPTFDIDTDTLEDQRTPTHKDLPEIVPGRTLHIDGDFLAYMVSYDDSKSVLEMQHNCDVKLETLRLQAGAEKSVIHLTPKESTKGNRHALAIQKEYQGNRKGKAKPKYLHMIRNYMADEHGALMCRSYEADDSMCMAVQKSRDAGEVGLAVIATKDKDLRMIPGLQLHWDTADLEDTEDDFGWIKLDDSKKTKKVIGRGYKFFWAQLLMGDSADNIQGLPKIIHPEFTGGKLKAVGPVMAHAVLENIQSNKDAFDLTKRLFRDTGIKKPYKHWKTGEEVEWHKVMLSEMQLLWMRRYDDEEDILKWLREITS